MRKISLNNLKGLTKSSTGLSLSEVQSQRNKFGENVLHYSCKVGATISTLSLINEGADIEKTNSAKNTPFANALISGHEDLCIFLI